MAETDPLVIFARGDAREPTPGPWTVGSKNLDPDGLPEIIILAPHPFNDHYSVASVLPCCAGVLNRDLQPLMTEANAHLISAAWDFLEGAEMMLANEDRGGDGWWQGWEKVKTAAAKARGREANR